MKFIENQVYHVFNQGNNGRNIFYSERNYHYFLGKMKHHLIPYVDILAYCLMPNHFHWLIRTKADAVKPSNGHKPLSRIDITNMKQLLKEQKFIEDPESTFLEIELFNKQQNLCNEIGILLRSFSRAVNIQESFSGSLFRKRTKAKDGAKGMHADFDMFDGVELLTNRRYQKICFDYIHQNPVKAGFVNHEVEWPFSSAVNYLLNQPSDLCNIEAAEMLGLLNHSTLVIDI